MSQSEQLFSTTQVFADPGLNTRFYTAVELLAQVMMVMPRAITVTSLAEATGKTPRSIRSILSMLSQDGLVSRDSKDKEAWHCRDCNGVITLGDVYRCFAEAEARVAMKAAGKAQKKTAVSGLAGESARSSNQQSVDLLMIQVRMTLNRAMLQQLEQFDLSRLRGLAASTATRSVQHRLRPYVAEPY